MTQQNDLAGLELRSLVTPEGELVLSLEDVPVAGPAADEVVVRIEAAPINPSDLGLLLGPADVTAIRLEGTAERPVVRAPIPEKAMPAMAPRLGQSMPVGNEAAGTVIRAGPDARALLGRTVAVLGGAMYTRYRTLRATACVPLPEGTPARAGASAFVNPLTALGFVETMRMEGHSALVHTAAASNLGQMLNRLCLADGVPLVNVVRSQAQADILRAIGATHIVDSTASDFRERLTDAIAETGATLGFDATGGGPLAGQILAAMEAAQVRKMTEYSRYGSFTHKQVYVYGMLDPRPLEIGKNLGLAWGLGGWLLTPFLMKAGPETQARLRTRVAENLTTIFASHYTAEISLEEALQPEVIRAYARRATGEKYLLNPAK